MLPEPTDTLQQRYRDNFARHLLGVALYLQAEIMRSMTQRHGHSGLRINFEPYITIIGRSGARLSDIAQLLDISRQAANQTANQIESAGYIKRQADLFDGRAKLLVPTARGLSLLDDGASEALRMQKQVERIVGAETLADSSRTLARLNSKLGLLALQPGDSDAATRVPLAGLLPRLGDYVTKRLMHMTIARGHPALKPSYGQVLIAIGPAGGRIQQIADIHGVSKQAISAIATELEELDYIKRSPDPQDARQVVLHFTPAGLGLIEDSVASVDDLCREFAAIVGARPLTRLANALRILYRALHLEEGIFGNTSPAGIRVLAGQLKAQLGEEGARLLGQLLLSPSAT